MQQTAPSAAGQPSADSTVGRKPPSRTFRTTVSGGERPRSTSALVRRRFPHHLWRPQTEEHASQTSRSGIVVAGGAFSQITSRFVVESTHDSGTFPRNVLVARSIPKKTSDRRRWIGRPISTRPIARARLQGVG